MPTEPFPSKSAGQPSHGPQLTGARCSERLMAIVGMNLGRIAGVTVLAVQSIMGAGARRRGGGVLQ